jgi:hypothetical protein
VKRFYQDVGSINVGVIPQDMALSGDGLSRIQTDSQKNFSVYRSPSFKSGTEAVWEFSGGTPVAEAAQPGPESAPTSEITPMDNPVGRNALLIGSLLLMGFVLVLWYGFNRTTNGGGSRQDFHVRELKQRRDQLLDSLAELDHRNEQQSVEPQEYLRQREEGKRQLRRISLLLKK